MVSSWIFLGLSEFKMYHARFGPIHLWCKVAPSRSLALAVPCASVALSMAPQRAVGKLRLRLGHEAGQLHQILCKQKEVAVERIRKNDSSWYKFLET